MLQTGLPPPPDMASDALVELLSMDQPSSPSLPVLAQARFAGNGLRGWNIARCEPSRSKNEPEPSRNLPAVSVDIALTKSDAVVRNAKQTRDIMATITNKIESLSQSDTDGPVLGVAASIDASKIQVSQQ